MVDAPGQSYRTRTLRNWSPWRPDAQLPERNFTLFFGGSMASMRRMPTNGRGHLYHHHYREHHPDWLLVNTKGLRHDSTSIAAHVHADVTRKSCWSLQLKLNASTETVLTFISILLWFSVCRCDGRRCTAGRRVAQDRGCHDGVQVLLRASGHRWWLWCDAVPPLSFLHESADAAHCRTCPESAKS